MIIIKQVFIICLFAAVHHCRANVSFTSFHISRLWESVEQSYQQASSSLIFVYRDVVEKNTKIIGFFFYQIPRIIIVSLTNVMWPCGSVDTVVHENSTFQANKRSVHLLLLYVIFSNNLYKCCISLRNKQKQCDSMHVHDIKFSRDFEMYRVLLYSTDDGSVHIQTCVHSLCILIQVDVNI